MTVRRAGKILLAALGMASLCAFRFTAPLLSPGHLFLYHLQGDAVSVVGAVLFGLLLLWAVFAGYCALALSARPAAGRILWLLPMSFLPAASALILGSTLGWRYRGARLYPPLFGLLALLALSAVLRRNPTRFNSLIRAAQTVLAFVGMFGILSIVQILFAMNAVRNLNPPPRLADHASLAAGSASGSRVIWILFDELSYEQVYGHRLADLRLPAFDALARESVVFTDARPVGDDTARVVPSLMTGQPVFRVRSSLEGQLWTQPDEQSRWRRFQPEDTVFEDARRQGLHIGIAGWYNPYCRMLPGLLDRCFSTGREFESQWWNPEVSVSANSRLVLEHLLSGLDRFPPPQGQHPYFGLDLRVADYEQLLAASDSLLRDPSLRFVFLHLPVPHPPGFYNRRTGEFSATGTYLDNLVLADNTLAHLRDVMAQQGQWDSSTIVLMGDHSWRIALWKGSPGWTSEEEAASGGKSDDRPFYLVKMPDEQTEVEVSAPFSAVRTRALFDKLLDRQITTPDQLKAWSQEGH